MQTTRTAMTQPASSRLKLIVALLLPLGLVACGGGSSSSSPPSNNSTDWQPGVFQPASTFADQCANPRSGIDPTTGDPFPDEQGLGLDERNFLRSWSNDRYLWYDEIVDRDPANYKTLEYFDLLKTEATTPSGNPKDQYHFAMPTSEWQAQTQSGISVGYGATLLVTQPNPPRRALVAYVEPGSPAASGDAMLSRGTEILSIDGVDVVEGSDIDTLNAGLRPTEEGESHVFEVRDRDGTEREFSMTATQVTSTPVLEVDTVAGGEVGYILFNEHIATAEEALRDAIEELQSVQDLVLDLRYNGGGYLAIASQLAYMIAGPDSTSNRNFETLTFNDKHSDENVALPFYDETSGQFSLPPGQPLPTLDLQRVFVLTGPGTCSASEAIINGLRGVDVEVIQIGETTCGKPYGYYAQDNCGTTYLSIQFKGVNAKGFGDYPDGFSPQNQVSDAGTAIPGCSVEDDFAHDLGNPDEARLAAALHYRSSPNDPCAIPSASVQGKPGAFSLASPSTLSAVDGRILKSPALQGRLMHEQESR